MAAIPIPKEVQPSVAKLLQLSDEGAQEIMNALESAPLSFDDQELAENVAANVKSLEPNSANDIVQVLLSLYLIRSKVGVPIPGFINDFIEGVEQTDLKEILPKISTDKLKHWLSRFMGLRALAFTTNARTTQKEFEHTFCTGEMLTDIRPLFEPTNGDADASRVIAALITHTLKISYHQGNRVKDLFLAVDSDGLDTLEGLIAQARAESEQLQPLLDAAKIPYPTDGSD
jgi:hypothetical protein